MARATKGEIIGVYNCAAEACDALSGFAGDCLARQQGWSSDLFALEASFRDVRTCHEKLWRGSFERVAWACRAVNEYPAEVSYRASCSYLELLAELLDYISDLAFAVAKPQEWLERRSGDTQTPVPEFEFRPDESTQGFDHLVSKLRDFDFHLLSLHLYKEAVRATGDHYLATLNQTPPNRRTPETKAAQGLLLKAQADGVAPNYDAISAASGAGVKVVRNIASQLGITKEKHHLGSR